jgi:predicted Ser/Thr protein kinase
MADDDSTRRVMADGGGDSDNAPTVRGLTPEQQVFGRYVLRTMLGRGGMGVVWRAYDGKLERDVALKFLPEVVRNDPEAVRELKHETRCCLQLTHANIVRVYDFVEDGTMAAIAMEYVDGRSLAAWKTTHPGGHVTIAELAPLVAQLCAALDYAHGTAKIIHRDLKPANLLLAHDGQLKVTDFGIARSLGDTQTRLNGKEEMTSGTLAYMSPQQLLGQHPGPADDIYALGATLYELLTGKPPFHTGSVVSQIKEVPATALNARRREFGIGEPPVPPAWEETIMACLAKDVAQRPATAREVAARLALIPGTADRAPQIVGVPLTQASSSRSWWKIAAAAAVLALLGAAGYFGMRALQQRRAAGLAQAHEQQRMQAEAAQLRTDKEKAESALAAAKTEDERRDQAANALGDLIVRTTPPGAEVRVGTVVLDKSPLALKDQKPGRYPVRIRLNGYEDWDGEAEVKAGAPAALDVPLVRSRGQFVLETEPAGLNYHLQGPDFAQDGAAGPQPRELPTGRYLLTVARQGYADVTRYVEIRRNATTVNRVEVGGAIAGRWSWTVAGQAGSSGGKVTLSLNYRGSELVGSVSAPGQLPGSGADLTLSELSFKDDILTFSLTRILQGYRIVNRFSGRLEGNVIRGTIEAHGRNGQMSRREWEAQRVK